ncbi:MAG: 6-phosphogluconolactonase/glucosamine-6-phosphate isomerase/deaminase [Candidatus Azotimanducaceae bacterium]|jgi:6-phosphogluconolactonase/glucosamine-6-phosphate isomerase/deaminase
MKINASNQPEIASGTHVSEALKQGHKNYLVLLSGGSALSVLDSIDNAVLGPHITFMMADERFSDDPKINNYLQFTQTELYRQVGESGAKTINSVPDPKKGSSEETALSIEKTFEYYFKVHEDCYVLALMGIGEDGHIAGIFPKKSVGDFSQKFITNTLYISVHEKENKHQERMTITPYFIKKHVNEIVIFASGKNKCNGILQQLQNTDSSEHEVPALMLSRHKNATLYTDCTSL